MGAECSAPSLKPTALPLPLCPYFPTAGAGAKASQSSTSHVHLQTGPGGRRGSVTHRDSQAALQFHSAEVPPVVFGGQSVL